LIFAEHTAHLLLDKIKEKLGCGICKSENDPQELALWHHEQQRLMADDDAILLPHEEVLDMGAVCLSCIIRVREIKSPPIARLPLEPS